MADIHVIDQGMAYLGQVIACFLCQLLLLRVPGLQPSLNVAAHALQSCRCYYTCSLCISASDASNVSVQITLEVQLACPWQFSLDLELDGMNFLDA